MSYRSTGFAYKYKATVNTCTCTDVFTVITYISLARWSGIYGCSKPQPQAMPFWSVYCDKSLALCYNYYTLGKNTKNSEGCTLCTHVGKYMKPDWRQYSHMPRKIMAHNVQVTVNTCTCTDLFTIITTKDQSGGICNSYSTGGQGLAAVNKPCPQATPSDSVSLLP